MLLNFYIKGRLPGSASTAQDDSYVESAIHWTQTTTSALSAMSFDELMDNAKVRMEHVLEKWKQMFKFLSGDSVPTKRDIPPSSPEVREEKQEKGWLSGLTGVFSGIKGPSAAHTDHFEDPITGPVDTDGEVHADLVMVKTYRTLSAL